MGKNTMIRKAIRGHLQKNPNLEKLLPYIVGNIGFVFTKEDLSDIRAKLLENRRVRSFLSLMLRLCISLVGRVCINFLSQNSAFSVRRALFKFRNCACKTHWYPIVIRFMYEMIIL